MQSNKSTEVKPKTPQLLEIPIVADDDNSQGTSAEGVR